MNKVTVEIYKAIIEASIIGQAVKLTSDLSPFGNTVVCYFESKEMANTFRNFLPCGLTSGQTSGARYTQVAVTF